MHHYHLCPDCQTHNLARACCCCANHGRVSLQAELGDGVCGGIWALHLVLLVVGQSEDEHAVCTCVCTKQPLLSLQQPKYICLPQKLGV